MPLSFNAVQIDVRELPPVLQPLCLRIGDTFRIYPRIYLNEDGLLLYESEAEVAQVDQRTSRGANIIQEHNKSLKDLEVSTKVIGSGAGGNVVLAELEGTDVICKHVDVNHGLKQTSVQTELRIHLLLADNPHPNICWATHMRFDPTGIVTMVMPRLDITIRDMCNHSESRLDLRGVLLIFFSLLSALNYIHDKLKIVHRDVNPKNAMLLCNESCNDKKVQLIDFGSAKLYSDLPQTSQLGDSKLQDPYSLFCAPDTDQNQFGTFEDNKELDDISGLLSILVLIYSYEGTGTMSTPDDVCRYIDIFLTSICRDYKDVNCKIPTTAQLYERTKQFVNEDAKRMDYTGWTTYMQACLAAKEARKSSSQR